MLRTQNLNSVKSYGNFDSNQACTLREWKLGNLGVFQAEEAVDDVRIEFVEREVGEEYSTPSFYF